jgi:hypothetical protein
MAGNHTRPGSSPREPEQHLTRASGRHEGGGYDCDWPLRKLLKAAILAPIRNSLASEEASHA